MFPKKPMRKRHVYLDHAATTPVDPVVFGVMKPFFSDAAAFGNPSGLYKLGVDAKKAIDDARKIVADCLFAQPDTIVFTGSGTESCNLGILGLVRALNKKNAHIITTKIEHKAVLEPIKQLEKEGCAVTYLDVDEYGCIDLAAFKKALRPETVLVSIMWGNNEIGTINPIADIGREILKWRKANDAQFPYFHTDACQVAGVFDLSVEKTHVDLMSLNASKIYGPKGVGVLYTRRGVALEPIVFGGGQESGLRSGTENVAGIVGMAEALRLACESREKRNQEVDSLRSYFWECLCEQIEGVSLNGSAFGDERLPNNLSVRFDGVEAEQLVLYLDAYGIVCGTGSACTSSTSGASHVLSAIGLDAAGANETVRFTLGKSTTKKDIDYVMKYLPGIVINLKQT